MKLDTLDQRYDLVKEMIDKAFEFEESVANLEDDNDWGGAMVTLDNLAAVEDMICAEEIFLNTLNDMENVRSRDRDEQEIFMTILWDGLSTFNETVILYRLEHALSVLKNWGFRTEGGVKFQENYCEKFDALIKKYKELYDI